MSYTNLIVGGNSKFGQILREYLPGNYLDRKQFDLFKPNFETFDNLSVEHVIFLAKSRSRDFREVGKVCDTVFSLLDKIDYKHAWVFTSGMGTYSGSDNDQHLIYSAEKMLINFISYKKNFSQHRIHVIHPGHMDQIDVYRNMVQKFLLLLDEPPSENLIWYLPEQKYIPF